MLLNSIKKIEVFYLRSSAVRSKLRIKEAKKCKKKNLPFQFSIYLFQIKEPSLRTINDG